MTTYDIERVKQIESDLIDSQSATARALSSVRAILNAEPDTPEPIPTPPTKYQGEKIALGVGHSRSGDKGAKSIGGVYEWDYNNRVATLAAHKLGQLGIESFVVSQYEGNGYSLAMNWVADHLKARGATLAIELHFNAATSSAHGFEYLYWHKSTNGKKLAQAMLGAHRATSPIAPSRGIKALSGDRGSGFVSETHCPAIISEPFFGSNQGDWNYWRSRHDEAAQIIVDGVVNYLNFK